MKVRRRALGARRGVLLLVILALLAMFGLVAVAFVVVTGHAMRSSRAIQRMGQFERRRPQETIHHAFLQVVRGSHPTSVMGKHSLLEDMYGNRKVYGLMHHDPTNAVPPPGPSYFGENVATPPSGEYIQLIEFTPNILSPGVDARQCVGCVLTVVSGPQWLTGRSTRIVGYVPPNSDLAVPRGRQADGGS